MMRTSPSLAHLDKRTSMFRSLLSTAALAALIHVPAAMAAVHCNQACESLMDEGRVLREQGKLREAWAAFQRAHQADPSASAPVSTMANLLAVTADSAPADKAPAMRRQAEAMAREALRIDEHDPLAQETLRVLLDDQPAPLHVPTPEAAQAKAEGEALFAEKRFAEALAKYELAAQRDPLYSTAWVFAGDCFFMQKQWHEAEIRFRKATEIEPLNGQAWRFLSDTLVIQGNRKAGEAALYGGIAAQPSQMPNWDKLELLMKHEGLSLKRLALVRKARFTGTGKDGKPTVEMTEGDAGQVPDQAFWLMHAVTVANAAKQPQTSPYQVELQAWQAAFKMVAEERAKGAPVPSDPGLIAMEKLAADGQLEPAILLLMYHESYRPELEAWKKTHPDGIRAFVVSTGLRP
jgi:tetratricopeptide (TPR) repeat protein